MTFELMAAQIEALKADDRFVRLVQCLQSRLSAASRLEEAQPHTPQAPDPINQLAYQLACDYIAAPSPDVGGEAVCIQLRDQVLALARTELQPEQHRISMLD